MAPLEQKPKGKGRPKKSDEKRGAHLRGPNYGKPKPPSGKPRGRPKNSDEKRGAHLRGPDFGKKPEPSGMKQGEHLKKK